MPTVQEGNLITPIRMPGYGGYFTGTDLRQTGTATAELNRKTLPSTRRYTDMFGDRTSMFNPLSDTPAYKTCPGSMLEKRARAFDRSTGVPRYNTFNCVDWTETKPITANDDRDSFDLLVKRANIYNTEKNVGPCHLHKPVSLENVFIQKNFDQYRTKKIFPIPGESDIGSHLYKTWDIVKPTFLRPDGVFRHKMWGVQQEPGTGLLDYRKQWLDNSRLYNRQEDYRRLVEDRRKTAGDVMAVRGVDYDNPASRHYQPMHVTSDVNPVQTQMCSLYKNGNLYTEPLSYVGPPLFY